MAAVAQQLLNDNRERPPPDPRAIEPDTLYKRKLKEDLMDECGIDFTLERPVYQIPNLTKQCALICAEVGMEEEEWDMLTVYEIAREVRTPRAIFPRRVGARCSYACRLSRPRRWRTVRTNSCRCVECIWISGVRSRRSTASQMTGKRSRAST